MKSEGEGAGDKADIARAKTGHDRVRRWRAGKIDGRRALMMQSLANLAAIGVVGRLRHRRRVLDDRSALMPRKTQIVVMPAEQDRLEQDGEQTEPRRDAAKRVVSDAQASRHFAQRPVRTTWCSATATPVSASSAA